MALNNNNSESNNDKYIDLIDANRIIDGELEENKNNK
jgi:hypothetical protein